MILLKHILNPQQTNLKTHCEIHYKICYQAHYQIHCQIHYQMNLVLNYYYKILHFILFIVYSNSSNSVWGQYLLFTLITESSVTNDKHLYDIFFLVFFCHENLFLFYLHMILFLSLCIYNYHLRQVYYEILIFIKLLTLYHIFIYFFFFNYYQSV